MVNPVFSLVSSRVMSTSTEREEPAAAGITVSFGERFAASDQFDAIFKEGMGLVERISRPAGPMEVVAARAPLPDNPVGPRATRLEEAFAKSPRRAAARG